MLGTSFNESKERKTLEDMENNLTRIYGASDDLVEMDGCIDDEYDCYDEGKMSFEVSDGTKGTIEYTGTWDITLSNQGSSFREIIRNVGEDDEHKHELSFNVRSYSDILILGNVEWIKLNGQTFNH